MPSSAAVADRLPRLPSRRSQRSRRPDFRDAAFVLVSLAAVAAVHRGTADMPGAATPAVLLATTALAMHVRLAKGRWPALAHVLASGALLATMSAALPLIGTVLVTGAAGAELIATSTRRATVLQAGAWTGLVAGIVSLAIANLLPLPPANALADAVAAMIGGLLSAPAMLVLGPLAEWLFGHTTRLTMGEWLNYEQPLLRGLSDAAPGTFQHSVNVGVLAAAAAAAVDADALLARLGGLYHDVGKMRAPQYFIENQRGTNPHDQLPPRESADILRAHVDDGVELVLAHRMGQRIADFVRQHHGTSEMRLLKEKGDALGEPNPDGEAYRYPGPKPRSREIGIVMIADQLEATAHAKPPHEEGACQELVRTTIARLREETQLEAAGLSDRDFTLIQGALARALRAMYHARMDYPDAGPPPRPPSRLGLLGRAFPRGR